MRIVIEIDCENDAFASYPAREAQRVCNDLLQKWRVHGKPADERARPSEFSAMDSNGNRCGTLRVVEG
jgi:hypothetical protein